MALGRTEDGAKSLEEAVCLAEDLVTRDPANGPSQLELIDSLYAQAKGFAAQAGVPGISSAGQADQWQRAIQALARCHERMNSPELQRTKLPLNQRAKEITRAANEAQAALAKIAAGGGPSPAPTETGKPHIKHP